MTSPVGSARVEITGDVSSFASEVQSELESTLAGISVTPVEVEGDFSSAEAGAEEASGSIAGSMEEGAEEASGALDGVEGDFSEPEIAAEEASESIATDFEEAGETSSAAMEAAAGVMVGAIAGVTVALGAAATGMAFAASSAADFGDDLDKTSARIGVTTDFLQDLRFWSDQNGVSSQSLERATGRLNQRLDDGAAGANQYVDAIQALGVATQDTNGEVRDSELVFRDVIQELSQVEDSSTRVARATEIFGDRVARDLAPALRDNALTLEDATAAMDDMGRVTEEQIDAAVLFADGWDQAKERIGSLLRDAAFPLTDWFGATLFPVLNEQILPLLSDVAEAFGEGGLGAALETFRDGIGEIGPDILDTLGETFDNIRSFLVDNAQDLAEFLIDNQANAADAVLSIVETLADALPTLIPQVVDAILGIVETAVDVLASAVPQIVAGAAVLITGLADGLIDALPLVIEAVGSIVQSVAEFIRDPQGLSAVVDAAVELVGALVEGIIELVTGGELQIAALSIVTGLVEASHALVPELVFLGHELVLGLIDGLIESMDRRDEDTGRTLIETLVDAVERHVPRLIDSGADMLQAVLEGFLEIMDRVGDTAEQMIDVLSDKFGDDETAEQLSAAAVEIMNLITTALVENIEMITMFITDTFIPEIQRILDENPELIDAGVEILVAIVIGMAESNHLLTEVLVTELIPTIITTLLGANAQMIEAGFELLVSFVAGMNQAVSGVVEGQLEVTRTSIVRFFDGAGDWLTQAGREIISGLWGGLRERWDGVESWLGGLGDRIRDLKGPESVDRALLRDPGRWIMQGLQEGLESERGNLDNQLRDITESIRSQFYGREEFTDREWQALMSGGVDAFEALKRRQFADDPRYDEEFFATERRRAENTLSMGSMDSMGGDGSWMGQHRIVIENLNITPMEGREFRMEDIERELERTGVM